VDFKFELCGHCSIESDMQMKEKGLKWLSLTNLDSTTYLQLVEVLARDRLSDTKVDLHSYVGLVIKGSESYSIIYLKTN
jgi:hypothetical protein